MTADAWTVVVIAVIILGIMYTVMYGEIKFWRKHYRQEEAENATLWNSNTRLRKEVWRLTRKLEDMNISIEDDPCDVYIKKE